MSQSISLQMILILGAVLHIHEANGQVNKQQPEVEAINRFRDGKQKNDSVNEGVIEKQPKVMSKPSKQQILAQISGFLKVTAICLFLAPLCNWIMSVVKLILDTKRSVFLFVIQLFLLSISLFGQFMGDSQNMKTICTCTTAALVAWMSINYIEFATLAAAMVFSLANSVVLAVHVLFSVVFGVITIFTHQKLFGSLFVFFISGFAWVFVYSVLFDESSKSQKNKLLTSTHTHLGVLALYVFLFVLCPGFHARYVQVFKYGVEYYAAAVVGAGFCILTGPWRFTGHVETAPDDVKAALLHAPKHVKTVFVHALIFLAIIAGAVSLSFCTSLKAPGAILSFCGFFTIVFWIFANQNGRKIQIGCGLGGALIMLVALWMNKTGGEMV